MPRCVTLDPHFTKAELYVRHCQVSAPVERSPLPNRCPLVGSDHRAEQRLSICFHFRRITIEICRRGAGQASG